VLLEPYKVIQGEPIDAQCDPGRSWVGRDTVRRLQVTELLEVQPIVTEDHRDAEATRSRRVLLYHQFLHRRDKLSHSIYYHSLARYLCMLRRGMLNDLNSGL